MPFFLILPFSPLYRMRKGTMVWYQFIDLTKKRRLIFVRLDSTQQNIVMLLDRWWAAHGMSSVFSPLAFGLQCIFHFHFIISAPLCVFFVLLHHFQFKFSVSKHVSCLQAQRMFTWSKQTSPSTPGILHRPAVQFCCQALQVDYLFSAKVNSCSIVSFISASD